MHLLQKFPGSPFVRTLYATVARPDPSHRPGRRRNTACTARWLSLLFWALLALPAAMQSQDFSYSTNSGGTITLGRYTGAGGLVNIPGTITGRPVTGFAQGVFDNDARVTSVTIPKSITNMGGTQFLGCWRLTNLTVDAANLAYRSVEGVLCDKGGTTLLRCPGGKAGNYTIPDSISRIEIYAFFGCSNLINVTIPNSVTTIRDSAFGNCSGLTSVALPNSVTTIRDSTFGNCSGLTSVALPNSVTNIGSSAFAGCSGLTSVTLPSSVTYIGASTFDSCKSLTNITVDAANPAYRSVEGVLFDKSVTTLLRCPGGKAGNYTIPNSVTSIYSLAFARCSGLTNVTLPNSVTTIWDMVFFGCSSLINVTIPSSVTYIGGSVFSGCRSLTNVTVDAANPAYRSVEGVLFDKSVTTLILWPAGKAGDYTIPTGVTNIGNSAFDSCNSLRSVTIPASVARIENSAFDSCISLTGVYFNGNAPSYGSNGFTRSDMATIYYLPGSTGWGATYGRLPTAPWLPRVLTDDAGFGLHTNRFGFNLAWASGRTVVVEATPDLFNPVWTPVATNTLAGGSSYFSDPDWANHPGRFYRLRSP